MSLPETVVRTEPMSCWSCDSRIDGVVRESCFRGEVRRTFMYRCGHCDVFGGSASDYVRPDFTDPDYMRDNGFIDHAIVHMPSPA